MGDKIKSIKITLRGEPGNYTIENMKSPGRGTQIG
jgi:hypothetical protein